MLNENFRVFFQENAAVEPRLGHGRFLPNPFQLIIHESSYNSTLYITRTERVATHTHLSLDKGEYLVQSSKLLLALDSALVLGIGPQSVPIIIQETLANPITVNPDRNMKNSVHS
jgi:hypothetical protein